MGADCTFLLFLVFDPRLQTLDLPAEVGDDAGVLVDVVGDVPQVTFYLVSQNNVNIRPTVCYWYNGCKQSYAFSWRRTESCDREEFSLMGGETVN